MFGVVWCCLVLFGVVAVGVVAVGVVVVVVGFIGEHQLAHLSKENP